MTRNLHRVSISVVDAFTDQPFKGNPAAVCFIGSENPPDKIMQAIASEMNLAETAFVVSKNQNYKEDSHFGLRWFSPTNEVPLCGHATLASAAALFETARNTNSTITFSTLSGDLFATKQHDSFINMDLPLNEPKKCDDISFCAAACDIVLGKFRDALDEIWLSDNEDKDLVIKMNSSFSKSDLESLNPNFEKLLNSHDGSIFRGIIVTTAGDVNPHDFYSRYFAPWNGIPEDHVTGSAHTVLAPFWQNITGKSEMLGRQCSKRGGDVKVKMREDKRVDVGGKAMVVLNGSISIPEF